MICPAYQSAFIHDKPTQKETFVYYNANKNQSREVLASNSKTLNLPPLDSTWSNSVVLPGPALPKERRTKKTRYLLLPEKTYKKALRSLQTVEMKPIYPKKQTDSVDIKKALDSAARSITDTLSASAASAATTDGKAKDSTYVISIEKEKFNVEQDNYMWYFRNVLVLPDVRIAMEGAPTPGKSTTKEKKGFFGFFKNMFKKKPKENVKPAEIQSQPSDSTTVLPPKQKKGLLGMFKKKPKVDPAQEQKKIDVAKKEEEEKF
jgi:cell division septation protein DedD